MSDYSCLSILKTKTKKLARIQKIKLSEALEIVAKDAKFTSYHELSEVAKRDPLEQRLVLAAMGESSLEDIIYSDDIFYAIDREAEERLSGNIAETNAIASVSKILKQQRLITTQNEAFWSSRLYLIIREIKTLNALSRVPPLKLLREWSFFSVTMNGASSKTA